MGEWHFFPWNFQYLIGAVIALSITVPLYMSNRKSWAYKSFFGFGMGIFIWCLATFGHRNAPNEELSSFFFLIDIFCLCIVYPLYFLMLLFLWKEKIQFLIGLIPSNIIGFCFLILSPYTIIWSELGWTYKFNPLFNIIFNSNLFVYVILTLITGIYLLKKVPLKILNKKIKLIIAGLGIITISGFISNYITQIIPDAPPFGGILQLILFITIAIAISLKEEDLELKFEDVYSRFISGLFAIMPGKEFGQNLIEFSKYIHFTGNEDTIFISGDSYLFDKEKLYKRNLIETLIKNIEYLEVFEYSNKIYKEFRDFFSYVYRQSLSMPDQEGKKTFENIIKNHIELLLESHAIYNIGSIDFLKLIKKDCALKGTKSYEKLKNFYEIIRLALNAYTQNILKNNYQLIPAPHKDHKKNITSIFMEYNLLLYDRYSNIRGKTIDFEQSFVNLTAEILRLHRKKTHDLPVIPIFFLERLLNELYHSFPGNITKTNLRKLIRKDNIFKFMKITGQHIFIPYFSECMYRNRIIKIGKMFANNLIDTFSEHSLKRFLQIMKQFSLPEAEVIIKEGDVTIIKNNNNLGFLLFNSFTNLGFSTLYIGKKTEGISLNSREFIYIEKKSLLDEVSYENQVSFNNLDKLLKTIIRFVNDYENAVIMINSLDDILYINSFYKVLEFIEKIHIKVHNKNTRLIILGSLLVLNEKELESMENKFNMLKRSNFYYNK